MSPTLGEKLKQARESRGMSISNVSEQTRIASHHLAAIEEDNFQGLPGGIFNKGFIRSFAKCVGISEEEALSDYAALVGGPASEKAAEELYSPAVYSDAGGINSTTTTIVMVASVALIAVVGAGAFVYYLIEDEPAPAEQVQRIEQPVQTVEPPVEAPSPTPASSGISVEISAADELVQFMTDSDGTKRQVNLQPGQTETLGAETELKLRFYRTLVPLVTMKLNGKEIALQKPKGNVLEVVIDKQSVSRIYEAGAYSEVLGTRDGATGDSSQATNAPAPSSGETADPVGAAAAPRPVVNRPRPNTNRPATSRPRVSSNAATSVPN